MTDRGRLQRLFVGLLLLAASIAVLNLQGRWLLAQGYARYANESLQVAIGDPDTRVATEWAVRLEPFPVTPHLLAAAVLEQQSRHGAALAHSRSALRYGAADPMVWLSHAHLKLRLGEIDNELSEALRRIDQIAPRSYWIQYRKAMLGLSYWEWSTIDQRSSWRTSIAFVLDTEPRQFLRDVLLSRQENLFCREFRRHSGEFEPWCQGALMARRICFTPPVPQHALSWCEQLGFARDVADGF